MLPSAPYLRWRMNSLLRDTGLDLPKGSLYLNDMTIRIEQPDIWPHSNVFPRRVAHFLKEWDFDDLISMANTVEVYYKVMRK